MKSFSGLRLLTSFCAMAALGISSLLSGCGIKGPLTMPDYPAPPATPDINATLAAPSSGHDRQPIPLDDAMQPSP